MRNRSIAVLSIALLIIQLGISTCHCLHENVWFRAAAGALGMTGPEPAECVRHHCHPGFPGDDANQPHDENCDCQGESVFVSGRDMPLPQLDHLGWLARADESDQVLWPPPAPWQATCCLSGWTNAVAVRAQLGVYLL